VGPPGAGPLTLGTAGHIDHGKTALVEALTGVDTDRLEEEKRRGISIALGYAPLVLPSGRRLSVIDVPGHERFVHTMVAGATGIDLYLMVVAADDGVMPQTREHAAVLAGLGVDRGVVAVTKSDIADPAHAAAAARELLPTAPIVGCSVRTGEGLPELLATLDEVTEGMTGRGADDGAAIMHVDRVFSVRGAGTVATGTLWSGSVGRGDELVVHPAAVRARVRGVEVHDQRVDRADAGQRVAVNLVGLARDEIHRGDVLAAADADVAGSFILDVALDVRLHDTPRVHVHHGTRETPARVAWLGGRFHQLRCKEPLLARRGDRLVIRQIAPPDTLGGGVVLDPAARKHGPSREVTARLERALRGDPEPAFPDLSRIPRQIRVAALSPEAIELEGRLRAAGVDAPLVSDVDPSLLAELRAHGRAERVGRVAMHHDTLAAVEQTVRALIARDGAVTLAVLRDELNTSRKYAQALLEHLDAKRVTRRLPDDSRALSRRASG